MSHTTYQENRLHDNRPKLTCDKNLPKRGVVKLQNSLIKEILMTERIIRLIVMPSLVLFLLGPFAVSGAKFTSVYEPTFGQVVDSSQRESIHPMQNRSKFLRSQNAVKNSYIVVLDDTVKTHAASVAAELSARHGGSVQIAFERALKGFAATMTEQQAIAMLQDPRVAHIEEDTPLTLATTTQNVDYNLYQLDRIDQRTRLPLSGTYTYCVDGTGVNVYVLDTGVWRNHNEFTMGGYSRVTPGIDVRYLPASQGTPDNPCPNLQNEVNAFNCNFGQALNASHGTAVASVIGGKTYGVAKNVTIIPVRVADCNGYGTVTNVIWGLDSILTVHQAGTLAVANLSFVIPWDYTSDVSLTRAVNRVIDAGITVVAAAGNFQRTAGAFMPANNPRVITVGGSDRQDARWIDYIYGTNEGSNYGDLIDVFAPAEARAAHIWGCVHYSPPPHDPYAIRPSHSAGTSFACAVVTGVVAQYLQAHPTATPAEVENWIKTNATADRLQTTNPYLWSPNRLIYSTCQ
jgi:subtilisin family serine protease